MYHIPVLLSSSVDLLDIKADGIYVDVTFGGGGHSRHILERLGKNGRLIAFDQDKDALANAPQDKRFTLVNNNFRFLRSCVRALGVEQVDGILADLGVSSHHFDTAERGFSFRFDAPLDMRMNQSATLTAARVVNEYEPQALATLFGRYGELDKPFRIANAIERQRAVEPITTINELLKATEGCAPRGTENKFNAKLFQALRLEVNGEMQALEMMLGGALKLLKTGGRLSVISYHSLEDRMVKNFFRSGNFEGRVEKDFYGNVICPWGEVTRKVVVPSEQEVLENPRARSAKLRAAEKK